MKYYLSIFLSLTILLSACEGETPEQPALPKLSIRNEAVQEGYQERGCHPQKVPTAWRDYGNERVSVQLCVEEGRGSRASEARPSARHEVILLVLLGKRRLTCPRIDRTCVGMSMDCFIEPIGTIMKLSRLTSKPLELTLRINKSFVTCPCYRCK